MKIFIQTRRNLWSICKTFSLAIIVSLFMMSVNSDVRGQFTDSFNPNVNNGVGKILVQPDGKILISGGFTVVNGQARNRVARLNADGTLDTSFADPNPDNQILTLKLLSDGKVFIGGSFLNVAGQPRQRLARLNADGTLDTGFNVNIDQGTTGGVYSIEEQTDGKIVIGGFFTNVGGQPHNRVARFNPNGSLDTSFNPDFNSTVSVVKLQPDGKILVGGVFTTVNGVSCNRLARLNSDGTLDTSFNSPYTINPNGNGPFAIKILSDGNLLIGGGTPTNDPISKLIKTSSDGTLDAAFNQNSRVINGVVRNITVQTDGKILIGGILSSGNNRFRYNADGTPDTKFNPNPTSSITDAAVLTDGKILLSGGFGEIFGVRRSNMARISDEPRRPARFDFNGDGIADQTVFRPSNRAWYMNRSNLGFGATIFGDSTDRLAPADYDGDGRTDFGVFRNGTWYWMAYYNFSAGSPVNSVQFGAAGDTPVSADYTGDGRAEIAFFWSGYWYMLNLSNNQIRTVQWGLPADKPVPADYDGDGKTDVAVVRQENGLSTWYIQGSTNGFYAIQFGSDTDKLVPADYDGDGKTDVAVFRDGFWYILRTTDGFYGTQFGFASDIPVAADYDGDGKTDIAVYREGFWYILGSQQGFNTVHFGATTDIPIPAVYAP